MKATVVDAVLSNDGLVCTVLSFVELKEVPTVSLVSHQFKKAVTVVQPGLCQAWIRQHYPHIEPLIQLLPTKYRCEWSRYVQQALQISSRRSEKSAGLNTQLQKELEILFHPIGVLSFANCCCNARCALANYHGFQFRDDFSLFFRLYVDGPNVSVVVTGDRQNKFMDEWDNTDNIKDLIRVWCGALGMHQSEYQVTEPELEYGTRIFRIQFETPIRKLEPTPLDVSNFFFGFRLFLFTVDHEELEEEEVDADDEDLVDDDYDEEGEELLELDDEDNDTDIKDTDGVARVLFPYNEVEGEEEGYSSDEDELLPALAYY
ncbi:MAG: hypothetical protein SGARI_005089 [Bacillariaceae sp.]